MVVRVPGPIESRPLVAEDRPMPAPGSREILVRVAACAVCRTDLHVTEGDLALRRPVVPGHQVVGRVEAHGAGATRFARGDRVGIAWLRWTCGTCAFCTTGRENLCRAAEFTGWSADGGFADYAVVHEDWAYRIPDVFDDVEAAPLLCAGIIGYRALRLAGVPRGGRLGIYGFGSSAHLTLQVALAHGLTVYVSTRGVAGQVRARTLGAAWAGDVESAMPYATDGTIIFAPAGDLVPKALAALAPGGTLVLAGIYMTPAAADTVRASLRRTDDPERHRQHARRWRGAPGRGGVHPPPAGDPVVPIDGRERGACAPEGGRAPRHRRARARGGPLTPAAPDADNRGPHRTAPPGAGGRS
jgi:alcohol dehydrogenase, propanol-preferring